jgi:hypothetical protein
MAVYERLAGGFLASFVERLRAGTLMLFLGWSGGGDAGRLLGTVALRIHARAAAMFGGGELDRHGRRRLFNGPVRSPLSVNESTQSAKYFAARSSSVPFVRIVVEPTSLSIPFMPSAESRIPPLGSQ